MWSQAALPSNHRESLHPRADKTWSYPLTLQCYTDSKELSLRLSCNTITALANTFLEFSWKLLVAVCENNLLGLDPEAF